MENHGKFIEFYSGKALVTLSVHIDWSLMGRPTLSHLHLSFSNSSQKLSTLKHSLLIVFYLDYGYRDVRPSVVAAACVASARRCLGCTPTWTPALVNLTGYAWEDIQHVSDEMIRYYLQLFKLAFG